MHIREAKAIADDLVAMMSPHCHRIEIAGSIRRARQDVRDIEIVAIPKWDTRPGSDLPLFGGEPERVNLLHEWAQRVDGPGGELRGYVRWIKPGTHLVLPWPPKPEGKYWRALVGGRIKLDLFLASRDNWGIILAIRTGSAEFSQAMMTYAKHKTCYHVEGGHLRDRRGTALETREERDVFDALGIDWVEPRNRSGQHVVTRNGRPQFASRRRAEEYVY
jgi:DNA polymerase/3'-5' exonuclease PolX